MERGGTMYILKCADDTLYVGSTTNLSARLWQHEHGTGAQYTRRRRPVRLVYVEHFENVVAAYEREKQVQGWSRAKRDALVEGRADKIRSDMPTTWARGRAAERERRRRRDT